MEKVAVIGCLCVEGKRAVFKNRVISFDEIMGVTIIDKAYGIDLGVQYLGFILKSGKTLITSMPADYLLIRLFKKGDLWCQPRAKAQQEWLGEERYLNNVESYTRLSHGVSLPVQQEVIEQVKPEVVVVEQDKEPIRYTGNHIVVKKSNLVKVADDVTYELDKEEQRWVKQEESTRFPGNIVRTDRSGIRQTFINNTQFRGVLTEYVNGGERVYWNYLKDHPIICCEIGLPFRRDLKVTYDKRHVIFQYHYDKHGQEYTYRHEIGSTIITKKHSVTGIVSYHIGGITHEDKLGFDIIQIYS